MARRKVTGCFPQGGGVRPPLWDGRGEKSPDGDFPARRKGIVTGDRVCGSLFLCAPCFNGNGIAVTTAMIIERVYYTKI